MTKYFQGVGTGVMLAVMFMLIISVVNNNIAEGRQEAIYEITDIETPKREAQWSQWQEFEATAYTHMDDGWNKITKTEFVLSPQARVVAVDPSVIPLGSKVEIKGYGVYYAEDIGGAIKGNRIDVFHWIYDEAMEFGRRKVQIRWRKD